MCAASLFRREGYSETLSNRFVVSLTFECSKMSVNYSNLEIERLSERLAAMSAASIIYWAAKEFGSDLVVSSSFQTQSLPLLHIVSRIAPNTPVFFLDTGYHFPQTIEYRENLTALLGLNVVVLKPLAERGTHKAEEGELHQLNPNMCCYLKKVEPLQRALVGKKAWISGVRRDQTAERAKMPVVALHDNERLKICPMLRWTHEFVMSYIQKHQLPKHPLLDKGYKSIGCEPCTKPVLENEDSRSGRWLDSDKTECGIHFDQAGQIVRPD